MVIFAWHRVEMSIIMSSVRDLLLAEMGCVWVFIFLSVRSTGVLGALLSTTINFSLGCLGIYFFHLLVHLSCVTICGGVWVQVRPPRAHPFGAYSIVLSHGKKSQDTRPPSGSLQLLDDGGRVR
jgi:glucan phosphoethanolaminetransferase (alkaline phosphatase superfamily)